MKESLELWRQRHDKVVREYTDANNKHHNTVTDLKAELKSAHVINRSQENNADTIDTLNETIGRLRDELTKNRAEYIRALNTC